ncbi:MAG: DUF1326 domain-containing protein [Actinomycetota bacterium]
MGWKLKGHYVQACSCTSVCPCPTASAPPDNPDGTTDCWGAGIFDITEGNLDDLDLSGVKTGMTVHFPGLVSDGSWHIGIVIDDSASDAQASALEQIFGGKLGGPFGDMAGLITEFTVDRGELSYTASSVSMGGSSYTYEPSRGQDGNATTVSNAAFGFAPVYEIGAASGTLESFGHSAPASYGEAADFEYASESHEHIRA